VNTRNATRSILYSPSIQFNDRWFVVIPGRRYVQEALVVGVTENTVLLQTDDINTLARFGIELDCEPVRYVKDDVRWVEKVVTVSTVA